MRMIAVQCPFHRMYNWDPARIVVLAKHHSFIHSLSKYQVRAYHVSILLQCLEIQWRTGQNQSLRSCSYIPSYQRSHVIKPWQSNVKEGCVDVKQGIPSGLGEAGGNSASWRGSFWREWPPGEEIVKLRLGELAFSWRKEAGEALKSLPGREDLPRLLGRRELSASD